MARRTKRPDGLLQKSFRLDVKGVSKRFVVYGHNERELREKEQEKRNEIFRKTEKYGDPTVNEYYERWLKGRYFTVSESTRRGQQHVYNIVKKIEMPGCSGLCFGDLKIKNVDIDDLRTLQIALKDGRRTRTVNDYMSFIKHIFSDAFKERVIDYNPFVLLKDLRRTEEYARDTKHRALSLEEQSDFFACERCKRSYYYNIFRFAICTGMRVGEIGSLKYSDIKDNNIHVERTVTRTESGGYVVGDRAKTAAGRRIIPMNDKIKEVVTDQIAFTKIYENKVSSLDDYIFKSVEGGLLLATPIDREIRRICRSIGIAPFTMHAFRATFATRAIESGMNPKTLQEILGHSNYNITMSLYGHCLESTKKKEMDMIASAF